MSIPRTTGYKELVKITEAALKGDIESAKKYVNRFLIKWPESSLAATYLRLGWNRITSAQTSAKLKNKT